MNEDEIISVLVDMPVSLINRLVEVGSGSLDKGLLIMAFTESFLERQFEDYGLAEEVRSKLFSALDDALGKVAKGNQHEEN